MGVVQVCLDSTCCFYFSSINRIHRSSKTLTFFQLLAAHGNHRNTCTGTGTTRPCIQSCLSEHFYTSKTSTTSECNRYTPFPTFLLFISTLPPICPFSTTPTKLFQNPQCCFKSSHLGHSFFLILASHTLFHNCL